MHFPTIRTAARIPGLALTVLLALGAGCYQVPVTGRTALNTVSDEAVNKMSLKAFEQLKKTQPVSRNKALAARGQPGGERPAQVSFWDVPNAAWEFVLFDVPNQINAFAIDARDAGRDI